MKTKQLLLFALAAILAAGCLSAEPRSSAISIGMTKEQVLKVMGPPASSASDAAGEYLNYEIQETEFRAASDRPTLYRIRLVDGKVVSCGRLREPAPDYHPKPNPVIVDPIS